MPANKLVVSEELVLWKRFATPRNHAVCSPFPLRKVASEAANARRVLPRPTPSMDRAAS